MTKKSAPANVANTNYWTPRGIYLSCLGLIQMIAYWSYYAQFPGLLSKSGIEPVERIFSQAAPFVYQRWILTGKIDEDSLCELLSLFGMILSGVIASGACQHASLFAANVAIYGLLVRTGGTFFSFQWDTLLLETTAITCLTYAPWTRLKPTDETTSSVAPIALRFLLFKLMYMSGVVKLQARCPTWETLTALEFHFATQCLPGPLAWYAHQLPPFLLRLGVAATLWIEIPTTILLLLPFATARRTGVVLQVVLQIMILLTGNYNFFNLLTVVLCIPAWESKRDVSFGRFWQKVGTWFFLFWTLFSMFSLEQAKDGHLNVSLQQDSLWIQPELFLPWVPYGTLVLVGILSIYERSIFRLFHGAISLAVIRLVALPLAQIEGHPRKFFLRPLLTRFHQTYTQPYWLVNGYGLFRKMTGVGTVPPTLKALGWAGLPPSVVARPEIILEGVYHGSADDYWQELYLFRWKPGAVDAMPWQMTPHQPRLDWQMWFAALGDTAHNPWFINLMQKLLEGCEPVLDLVGADSKLKLRKIRAKLYHYDFTRLNTTWSQTIPGIEIVPDLSRQQPVPTVVWTRTLSGDYLPPVASRDLRDYLQSMGYKSFCMDPQNPCFHQWCPLAHALRRVRIDFWLAYALVAYIFHWSKKKGPLVKSSLEIQMERSRGRTNVLRKNQ